MSYRTKILLLIAVGMSLTIYRCTAQTIITDGNFTEAYNTIGGDFTLGNECGVDNFMYLYYEGDLTLTADLYLQDVLFTIYGDLNRNGFEIFSTCPDSELVIEGETLSVDVEALEDVTLFPNPTKGIFHVKTNKPFTIMIYDSKLGIVNDMPDLRHASAGVYLVRITIEEKTYTKRIIKQ